MELWRWEKQSKKWEDFQDKPLYHYLERQIMEFRIAKARILLAMKRDCNVTYLDEILSALLKSFPKYLVEYLKENADFLKLKRVLKTEIRKELVLRYYGENKNKIFPLKTRRDELSLREHVEMIFNYAE